VRLAVVGENARNLFWKTFLFADQLPTLCAPPMPRFILRAKDAQFLERMSFEDLNDILVLAFLNGWKAERVPVEPKHPTLVAPYLEDCEVSETDARAFTTALDRIAHEDTTTPKPNALIPLRRLSQRGAFGIKRVD